MPSGEPQPGDVIDGYRIGEPIGRGGMGVVFLAEHVGLHRRVAFKVLSADRAADPSFRRRFSREARLAARLDHPHVVTVHDAGVQDEQPWLAMAFVDGEDLRSRLGRLGGRMPVEEAVSVVEQVAAALDHAHAHGVLHRDVKPANILLTEREGRTFALLGDFGLTKEIDATDELTTTGTVIGSVDYLAPEALEQRPFDARLDVYALGATLLTALTGTPPFTGTPTARLSAHVNAPRPRVSARVAALKPFDAVIERGLAVDPEARYPSAGALARAARAAAGRVARADSPVTLTTGPGGGSTTLAETADRGSFEVVLHQRRRRPDAGSSPPTAAANVRRPNRPPSGSPVVVRRPAPVTPGPRAATPPTPSARILAARRAEIAAAAGRPVAGRRGPGLRWLGAGALGVVVLGGGLLVLLGGLGDHGTGLAAGGGAGFTADAVPRTFVGPGRWWSTVLPAANDGGWRAPETTHVNAPQIRRVVQRGPSSNAIVIDARRSGPVLLPPTGRVRLPGLRYRASYRSVVTTGGPGVLRCGAARRACVNVRVNATPTGPGWSVVASAPSSRQASATATRVADALRRRTP